MMSLFHQTSKTLNQSNNRESQHPKVQMAVNSCVLWHVSIYQSACVIRSSLSLACHWSLFIASGSYSWHTFGLQNEILTSWCPGSAKHSVLYVDSVKWLSAPLCYIQIWWELHWQKWQEVWWADKALDNHIGLECVAIVCVCVCVCVCVWGYTLCLCVINCREDLLFWELSWCRC